MQDIKSRTNSSIVNSAFSMFNQVITFVLQFIVKTIFIHILGSEYLGVNGLFTNIITMLSLVDLGIGIGIPYSLYKPLAEKNTHKIKALMKFYSKLYIIMGIIVLLLGLSLIPWLDFFIEGEHNIENLVLIYALFIINSASSYFFIYKKLLIESDQKSYIVTRITLVFNIALTIAQVFVLVVFKNYILYLIVNIASTILQNIYISHKCNKMYPYITEKVEEKLEKSDYMDIKKNISSLFIYRIGVVLLNGTDNIIISKMLGIVAVGIYSNYLMIVNAVNGILSQIFNAITASVGNLVVTDTRQRSESIFYILNFFNFWLYGVIGICLIALINPFINLWIGQEYVLTETTTFIVILNLYILGMQSVTSSYRNAYGLFKQGRYRPIAMVIINIVSSIVLARYIGILGVIIGTLLSRLLTTAWFDPFIVYKYGFQSSPIKYYRRYVLYMICFIILAIGIKQIIELIQITNFFVLILVAAILFIATNLIFFLLFGRTKECQYLYQLAKQKISAIMRYKKGVKTSC